MKTEGGSLRQVLLLAVTGLFSPAVDVLPKLLAERAGKGAWAVPLLAFPLLLLWAAVVGALLEMGERGFFGVLRQRLEKGMGVCVTILYMVWAVLLLREQFLLCAGRMGAVYEGSAGVWMALGILLLAGWSARKGGGGLYRAAQLFWLMMAVTASVVVLMSLPRLKVDYLWPEKIKGRELLRGVAEYINVWGSGILAAALLTHKPEKRMREAVGWLAVSCFGGAALIAVVLGQVGPNLTLKLSDPFFIAAQGLSVKGAIARLEAPVAGLWLLTDFCRMGLFLAVLKEAGGERYGNHLAAAGAVLAAVGGIAFPQRRGGGGLGLLLGVFLPFGLWVLGWCSKKEERSGISCGGEKSENHRYSKMGKKLRKRQKS